MCGTSTRPTHCCTPWDRAADDSALHAATITDPHIIDPSKWRLRSQRTLRPERQTALSRMQNRHIYDAMLSLVFERDGGYPRMFREDGAYAPLIEPVGAAGETIYDREVSRVYALAIRPCIPLRARQTLYELHAGAHGEHGWHPHDLGRWLSLIHI